MDNDRLLRNDFWKTVRSFAIAEELLVWEVDLSIGKPFSLSPGNILGYGAAFFLCQARHDGEQQFALAVKGVDVLFFEVDFYAFFFQFADGNQAVNRVSGEAADRLCDDEVDFTGHGVGNHFIKADAMLGIRAGNALIGIYLYKLPFGIAFDVSLTQLHSRLIWKTRRLMSSCSLMRKNTASSSRHLPSGSIANCTETQNNGGAA